VRCIFFFGAAGAGAGLGATKSADSGSHSSPNSAGRTRTLALPSKRARERGSAKVLTTERSALRTGERSNESSAVGAGSCRRDCVLGMLGSVRDASAVGSAADGGGESGGSEAQMDCSDVEAWMRGEAGGVCVLGRAKGGAAAWRSEGLTDAFAFSSSGE
jgi:hypothetical protein